MKKLIFALMIAIAVASSAPANAQSTTTCGFNACTKSFEISVLTSDSKLADFYTCYNAAWISYNGEIRKAKSFYWKCIAAAGGTAVSTFAACKTGILETARFKSWLKRKLPRYIPLACETKSLAAGIGFEVACGWEYWVTLDAICIDLDIAVELCANAADRNYKKCDL